VAESVDDMEALIQAELADMDEDDALIKDELENWLMSSSSTAAPARTQEAAETSQTEAAPQFVIPQAPSGKRAGAEGLALSYWHMRWSVVRCCLR
jgi:hypothetical protein